MPKTNRGLFWSLLVVILSSTLLNAQSSLEDAPPLANWISLDAPPGWEHLATDPIMKALPGWHRDSLGNLILRKGKGSPRRVVACGIDRPTFAVTEITDEGFLRLRELGSMRTHPLWTQFHEGQRIRILTRSGERPGVVTVKSTHLSRVRGVVTAVTTLDDLWVDVGATSSLEVQQLGIRMLDPVVHDFSSWRYGDYVAGPSAASRIGCAAVASASRNEVAGGETIFLISTLRSFGQDGLAAALRSLGRVDEVTIVDQPADESTENVSVRKVEKPSYLPESTGLTSLSILGPRVKYSSTLVESVHIVDANALLASVEKAANVTPGSRYQRWVELPPKGGWLERLDTFSETASLLQSLADTPSVSGHEREVREKIVAALPQWAKSKAITDEAGNLVVEAGPNVDPVIFIAHLDEVGYEITNVADDGTVSLRTRGGMFQSLWEGQPALLHFDTPGKPPLHGVFIPRSAATAKQPESTTASFGVNAATLKTLGVVVGQSVTADKHARRLSSKRFTARALDDRAGSTALILAARKLNPVLLKRRVIFAWSVREETGLEGAIVLAKRYGTLVKRAFSIDTFVSSDSPAEISRFAHAPLGRGAVIRGLDNSSVASPVEIDRILSVAKLNQIPLQVGATNGGTDGSEFVPYGVIHVSLSWPGRYSHSPVEVLDLRDLDSLSRLVHALATAN